MHAKAFHCIERMETCFPCAIAQVHCFYGHVQQIKMAPFNVFSHFFPYCTAFWLDKLQSDLRSWVEAWVQRSSHTILSLHVLIAS